MMEFRSMLASSSPAFRCSCAWPSRGPLTTLASAGSNKEFSHFKTPNQSTPSNQSKSAPMPVFLPGGRKIPGLTERMSNSGNQISPPGLGQFRPPPNGWVPMPDEPAQSVQGGRDTDAGSSSGTSTSGQIADDAPDNLWGSRGNDGQKALEEIVEQVRDRLGPWDKRARDIVSLQRMGLTAEDLYDATFISAERQTFMVVAAQVHSSLVAGGAAPELLDALDESSVDMLYELRTLSDAQRMAAVEYLVATGGEPMSAREIARAIKEHERRPQGREGFTTAPGDCLALMLLRASNELREGAQKMRQLEQALNVASSDSARARVKEAMGQ